MAKKTGDAKKGTEKNAGETWVAQAAGKGKELTVSEDAVWEALKSVVDPELQINVVDIGLIYKVEVDKGKSEVYVQMTMTSPACPVAGLIEESARSHVAQLPGVKNVIVEVVFEPPWNIEKMNPDVRASLGL